jgi:hypothetical protein
MLVTMTSNSDRGRSFSRGWPTKPRFSWPICSGPAPTAASGRLLRPAGSPPRPREHLDPPPLLTGNDLLAAGVPAGRAVGQTLAALRTLQLDGQIVSRDAALEWVHVHVNAGL